MTSPRQEVYERWRQLDGLPAFMAHLDDVTVTGPRTSHWRATAPFGRTVEWDAEITEDVPGERIAWRSVNPSDNGSRIRNSGTVRFMPARGGRDTEVHVTLSYALPAGKGGQAVARFFGEEPHQQLDDDLRRFKQVLETGEVVRSEGAPGGKRARGEFDLHLLDGYVPTMQGAVRRRERAQDRIGSRRRESAFPLRHSAHRLYGRGNVRHQAG